MVNSEVRVQIGALYHVARPTQQLDYVQHLSLKKHGVIVDCKHCKYASSNGYDDFDVIVPVSDSEAVIAGTAKLHCTVTNERHQVEMTEWQNANCVVRVVGGLLIIT